MVEHQIICKILEDQSLHIIKQHGLTVDEFPPDYQAEVQFILDHYNRYGNVPDKLTFLQNHKNFEIVMVHESEDYLVDALLEKHLHTKQMQMANEWGKMLGDPNSKEAFSYLTTKAEELRKIHLKKRRGTDITKDTTRQQMYHERKGLNGVIGLDTGMDEITKITKGWLGEDFVVILARTNEGKSWLLLYFLYVAWRNGVPALLYSGEMGTDVVGYRFDTIAGNFSNDALLSGFEKLADGNVGSKEYDEYFTNLGNNTTPFIVVTPKDLGQRLDIPMLHFLIETYQPGIVGIDQLSLMEDYRKKKGEQLRMQYTHVAEDLYSTSEKYKIPVLAPAQANRSAEGSKKKEESERKPPMVEDISESDGVGQNATRVLSMAVNGVTLTINVRKNRYGKKNQEARFLWDIDKGILKPFATVGEPPKQQPEQTEDGEEAPPVPQNTGGQELF